MANFKWNADLERRLKQDKANTQLEAISKFMVDSMRRQVPVRTGFLRDSITYAHDKKKVQSTVYVPPFYGIYVEFGTRFMRPQPFVRPALLDAVRIWKLTRVSILLRPRAQVSEPLQAMTAGFRRPRTQLLTAAQERHVKKYLSPVQRRFARQFREAGVRYRVGRVK